MTFPIFREKKDCNQPKPIAVQPKNDASQINCTLSLVPISPPFREGLGVGLHVTNATSGSQDDTDMHNLRR